MFRILNNPSRSPPEIPKKLIAAGRATSPLVNAVDKRMDAVWLPVLAWDQLDDRQPARAG
jgi:hypothetical protein